VLPFLIGKGKSTKNISRGKWGWGLGVKIAGEARWVMPWLNVNHNINNGFNEYLIYWSIDQIIETHILLMVFQL
jgi:hypothetical protein